MLDELAQSYAHLRNAAGHAAGGTAERLQPGYERAREFAARRMGSSKGAFSPFYEQVRHGAKNARRGLGSTTTSMRTFMPFMSEATHKTTNKWQMASRLLLAGAAVGAAGAIIRRRRQANQWEEYEPIPEIDDYGQRTGKSHSNFAESTAKMTHGAAGLGNKAASLAHAVSGKASKLADQLHERASRMPTDAELRGGPKPAGPGSTMGSGMGSGMGSSPGQGSAPGSRPQETTTFSGFAEGLDDDLGTPGRPVG